MACLVYLERIKAFDNRTFLKSLGGLGKNMANHLAQSVGDGVAEVTWRGVKTPRLGKFVFPSYRHVMVGWDCERVSWKWRQRRRTGQRIISALKTGALVQFEKDATTKYVDSPWTGVRKASDTVRPIRRALSHPRACFGKQRLANSSHAPWLLWRLNFIRMPRRNTSSRH